MKRPVLSQRRDTDQRTKVARLRCFSTKEGGSVCLKETRERQKREGGRKEDAAEFEKAYEEAKGVCVTTPTSRKPRKEERI